MGAHGRRAELLSWWKSDPHFLSGIPINPQALLWVSKQRAQLLRCHIQGKQSQQLNRNVALKSRGYSKPLSASLESHPQLIYWFQPLKMTMRRLSNTALLWKNKNISLTSIFFQYLLVLFYYSEIIYLLQYQLIIVFIPVKGKWSFKDLVTRRGWDAGRGRPFIKPSKGFLTHSASENNKSH